jgi:hypothetical protein
MLIIFYTAFPRRRLNRIVATKQVKGAHSGRIVGKDAIQTHQVAREVE